MTETNQSEYLKPTGQILDYVVFRDVKDGNYYKMYFYERRLHLDIVTEQSLIDEAVKYIKFIDMNDKRDTIMFSKEGKLRMEKI